MLQRWRRRRALRRVKTGDGRPLPAFRWWHALWRSCFVIEHGEPSDAASAYAVDVSFYDLDDRAQLYRDGSQHAVASMPAAFPVPGGVIEVAATTFGMKRVHLVLDSGEERQLRPVAGSAEHWRARVDRRAPRLSKWLGRAAIAVLLIGLVILLPQLAATVSQIPWIADRFGSFTAPISLPPWLNSTLAVAGFAASAERALTLRNHWLIDADTWLLGD